MQEEIELSLGGVTEVFWWSLQLPWPLRDVLRCLDGLKLLGSFNSNPTAAGVSEMWSWWLWCYRWRVSVWITYIWCMWGVWMIGLDRNALVWEIQFLTLWTLKLCKREEFGENKLCDCFGVIWMKDLISIYREMFEIFTKIFEFGSKFGSG